MKSKIQNLIHIVWTCSYVSALHAAPIAVQNDMKFEREIDLALALRQAKLEYEPIEQTLVAYSGDDPGDWRNGIFAIDGKVKPGAIGVTVGSKSQVSPPPFALKIRQGIEKLQGLIVDVCAGGLCKTIPAAQLGINQYFVQWEGLDLNFVHYGELCLKNELPGEKIENTSSPCSVFIPSWAVNSLVSSPDGGISGFPKKVLLIQTTNFLIVYDIDKKQVLSIHDLSKNNVIQSLGKLKRATFYGGGNLVMMFEGGAIEFSYSEDMVMVVSQSGDIFIKNSGISAPTFDGFMGISDDKEALVSNAPLFQSTHLLAMDHEIIISDRGLLRYQLTHLGFTKLDSLTRSEEQWLAGSINKKNEIIGTILAINTRDEIYLMRIVEDTHKKIRTISLPAQPLATNSKARIDDFKLVGDRILHQRTDGWSSPDDSIMFLQGSRLQEQTITETGTILVQKKYSTYSLLTPECEWVRHRTLLPKAGYFDDGVITAPCDASVKLNLAHGHGVESIVVREGPNSRMLLFFSQF